MSPIVTNPVRTDFASVKAAIHRKLIQKLNLDKLTEVNREDVRREVSQILEGIVHGESAPMNLQERERLVQEVLDEVFGLGPLEPLLADPTVSDILVNTWKRVYVERKGMLEPTNVQFRDDVHLMSIIDRIVSAIGRRVDESSPMVDARLKDGSRVNAIIPTPNGRVSNLTFGGKNGDTLFATCGDKVYKRKLKVKGANAWDVPLRPAPPRL